VGALPGGQLLAFAGINYLGVISAAVAGWLAGAAWYAVLARPWMIALGKIKSELMTPDGTRLIVPFVVAFLAQLVMAWVLAGIVGHVGVVTAVNGVISGLFAWLGFVITSLAVNYSFARQQFMLTLIDGGHWLLVLVLQGAVIGFFGA
jgi:hypothetical protein